MTSTVDASLRAKLVENPGLFSLKAVIETRFFMASSDIVSEMTEDAKVTLSDAYYRIQISVGTRADFDRVKAFWVRRRMRDEVDEAWTDTQFEALNNLWRTSKHYDGED